MLAAIRRERSLALAIAVYYLLLLAFLLASYLPEYRLWGLGHWLHYPDAVTLAFFGFGLIVPPVLVSVLNRNRGSTSLPSDPAPNELRFAVAAALLIVIFCLAFYLLRARTHFFGDGYSVLSRLATDEPIIKLRDIAVITIQKVICSILGGESDQRALTAYRITSFAGGLTFLGLALVSARAFFVGTTERILFSLGLLSGGYMILFFGYVENYSLFVPAVALFGITGILVTRGSLKRWVIVLPLALSIVLHVFGVTLIPAAIFVLLSNTRASAVWLRLKTSYKFALIASVAVAVALVFYHYYSTEYSFRFSLVPPARDRFTSDHYTLLSRRHLLDLVNLVLLLVPGILLLALTLWRNPENLRANRSTSIFLVVLVLSTLGAVFVFDPRLGMARDWDLFSFCGVPIALAGYYSALSKIRPGRSYQAPIMLAIAVGLLALFSRTYYQLDPDLSISRIKSYISLDPQRNRRGLHVILEYHKNLGDTILAQQELKQWPAIYPEWGVNRKGQQLLASGHFADAVGYFRKAIATNPSFAVAYSNLGSTYLYLEQYDSAIAYLEIANGMNPHSPDCLGNLGIAYYYAGDYAAAEKPLRRAADLDTISTVPLLAMAMLYRATGRDEAYLDCLVRLSQSPLVELDVLKDLATLYLVNGKYDEAAETIRLALGRGMDSAWVEGTKLRFPQLPL